MYQRSAEMIVYIMAEIGLAIAGKQSEYVTTKTKGDITMKKKSGFGYGRIKYQKAEDFPYEIDYNGCHWYRTMYDYTFIETGMVNFLYETYDREEDLRLYMDAAGHIWDEKEKGIL